MTISIPGFGKITATKGTLCKIAKMAEMSEEYAIEYGYKDYSLLYSDVREKIFMELNRYYGRVLN